MITRIFGGKPENNIQIYFHNPFSSSLPTFAATMSDNTDIASQIIAKLSSGVELTFDDLKQLRALTSSTPLLRRHHLSSSQTPTLVRHVGMVQDMLEPEYYIASYGGQSTHFRDVVDMATVDGEPSVVDKEPLGSQLAERQPLLVVPLPFCSEWFSQKVGRGQEVSLPSVVIPPSPDNETRKRDREPLTEEVNTANIRPKVHFGDDKDDDDMDCNKEEPLVQGQELDWWPAGCLKSPPDQCPVLAKFYYDQYSESDILRLNDVVEMIGILSMDPTEADFGDDDLAMFQGPRPPPPSRLPRMHVLSFSKVDWKDFGESDAVEKKDDQPNMTQGSTPNGLEQLKSILADPDLAEALWMTLLSKSERKLGKPSEPPAMVRGPQHALGCASLHLQTSNSQGVFQHLQSLLQQICPVLATLNRGQTRTAPMKVHGRMTPNPLQLPMGAVVLVHLDDSANKSISDTLHDLVMQQRQPYTFDGGMKVQFDADYRVIVVSSENVQVPCTLKLTVGDMELFSSSSLLDLRSNLSRCHGLGNVALDQSVLDQAQEDFLKLRGEARKLGETLPGEDDFHRWLTITRLQARCRGSTQATVDDWKGALRLDRAIQDRQ